MSVVNSNGVVLGAVTVATSATLATTGDSMVEVITKFLFGVVTILLAITGIQAIRNRILSAKLKRK